MGNHDLYDTPADIAREKKEEAFQNEVRVVHERLTAMPAGRFTVDELKSLMNLLGSSNRFAVPKYSNEDLKWLNALEAKIKNI